MQYFVCRRNLNKIGKHSARDLCVLLSGFSLACPIRVSLGACHTTISSRASDIAQTCSACLPSYTATQGTADYRWQSVPFLLPHHRNPDEVEIMEEFPSETDSDYTSYWRDWVSGFHKALHPGYALRKSENHLRGPMQFSAMPRNLQVVEQRTLHLPKSIHRRHGARRTPQGLGVTDLRRQFLWAGWRSRVISGATRDDLHCHGGTCGPTRSINVARYDAEDNRAKGHFADPTF